MFTEWRQVVDKSCAVAPSVRGMETPFKRMETDEVRMEAWGKRMEADDCD